MSDRILAHPVTVVGGKPLKIWAYTANINFFLKNPLTPAVAGAGRIGNAAVPGGSRERYPGDPEPITYRSYSRKFSVDSGARKGGALPGKPFVLTITTDGEIVQKRRFTYQGRFLDLKTFLKGQAAFDCELHGPSGKVIPLKAAAAGGGGGA